VFEIFQIMKWNGISSRLGALQLKNGMREQESEEEFIV